MVSYAAVRRRSLTLFSLGRSIFNKDVLALFINGVGSSRGGPYIASRRIAVSGFWSFSVAHFIPSKKSLTEHVPPVRKRVLSPASRPDPLGVTLRREFDIARSHISRHALRVGR
jgi:hypothetical protein